MENLQQKVAVITGAAEGIGKALAEALAAEGMNLVLADINLALLEQTAAQLRDAGATVHTMQVDVAQSAHIDALADLAFARCGAVHLLINNAGVAIAKSAWETTEQDWNWVMGVNLFGVTHALRAFVPRMLAAGQPGHIVNTASIAGLISVPSLSAYNVSKFGVVTLSEGLCHDLALRGADVGVSVLCPGWVKTRIAESERNRHDSADRSEVDSAPDAVSQRTGVAVVKAVHQGISPAQVADATVKAVKARQFYILTHPQTLQGVEIRLQDILQNRQPTLLPV